MEARELAVWHARGRQLVGAAFVVAPGLFGRAWIADDARRRPVKVLARAFGARDLALGLGVVIALDRGAPARGWIEAGALSDALDTCASLLAGNSIRLSVRWPCWRSAPDQPPSAPISRRSSTSRPHPSPGRRRRPS